MRTFFLTLILNLITLNAQALELSIKCTDQNGKPLPAPTSVVKVPFKEASGHWSAKFYVDYNGQRFPLINMGGDEDYLDFNIELKPGEQFELSTAQVQTNLKWAVLSDNDGNPVANCGN